MATYTAGPSTLRFADRAEPVLPGEVFEHDFSVDGPDGEHGPAREAALIAGGAIVLVVAAPVPSASEPSQNAPAASTVSPAPAASPVDQSVPSSDRRRGPVTEE